MGAFNSAPIALRDAVPEDREFLWWLHNETMREQIERTWRWDGAWQRQQFDLGFETMAIQIIEVAGHRVGCLSIRRSADAIYGDVMEIVPEFQNEGIGTRVLHMLFEECDRSCLPMQISVLKTNPARELYERLGFHYTGEAATYYIMRRESRDGPLARH
jgi:ribosomal protein S18 acetylase RimI-like enzyme